MCGGVEWVWSRIALSRRFVEILASECVGELALSADFSIYCREIVIYMSIRYDTLTPVIDKL